MQRQTQLHEWLAEQDEDEEQEGGYLLRTLTVAMFTAAAIYLGGHVVAALVR